jgi:hypothetical protein
MSLDRNKDVIRRLYAELWNEKSADACVSAVHTLFSPDLVVHRSGRPVLHGLDGRSARLHRRNGRGRTGAGIGCGWEGLP